MHLNLILKTGWICWISLVFYSSNFLDKDYYLDYFLEHLRSQDTFQTLSKLDYTHICLKITKSEIKQMKYEPSCQDATDSPGEWRTASMVRAFRYHRSEILGSVFIIQQWGKSIHCLPSLFTETNGDKTCPLNLYKKNPTY